MLFGADALDASGRKVQRQLVALNASVASRPRPVRLSKATVRSLLEDSDVRAALDRELARELSRISADTAATSLALQSRVRQILHELRREEQTPLFQASLFDRRTEQRAPAREAAVRIQCERCERRLVSAEALLSLNSVQPALIAAWPAR